LENFLWLCFFGILIVISVQSPILEITEQNLANHMVIEHNIFFFLGAASVRTAEISLRMLVSYAYKARRNHNAITRPKRNRNSVEHLHSGTNGFHGNDKSELPLSVTIIIFWSNSLRAVFSVSSNTVSSGFQFQSYW
jgi:hypothetical protein